jgi:hypothetical protein
MRVRHILLFLVAIASAGCSDPNALTPEGKDRLVERQQAHVERMRDTEEMMRSLNDPNTKEGRRRLREAAELTRSAENMLDMVENMQVDSE